MKCVICRTGQLSPGTTSVVFERGATTIVFKRVPASICDTCGEAYLDVTASEQLLQQATSAGESGVEVEVRSFAA